MLIGIGMRQRGLTLKATYRNLVHTILQPGCLVFFSDVILSQHFVLKEITFENNFMSICRVHELHLTQSDLPFSILLFVVYARAVFANYLKTILAETTENNGLTEGSALKIRVNYSTVYGRVLQHIKERRQIIKAN